MEPIYVLLLSFVGVLVCSWTFQGIRLRNNCKGDIYNDLYGSFFSYFLHYVILRDCSDSGYLRSKIGTNRIVFSNIQREDGVRTKFLIVFFNRGLMVICYDRATGSYSGGALHKHWHVVRTDKEGKKRTYRHLNPTTDLKAYLKRVATVFPDAHIEARIAFSNEADFSGLDLDVKPIHFRDIASELQNVQAEFVDDAQIKAMYHTLTKG